MTDVPGGVPGGSVPSPDDGLRVGNAERERVAQRLQEAFAEGRLDAAELQERLDLAYRAKTAGDLRPLTMDLPGGAHPGRQVGGGWPGSAAPTTGPTSFTAPASPAQAGNWSGPASWAPASVVFGGLGFAFAVNVVIWALVSATSGQLVYFWPIWIALPMLVSLLARAFVWTGGPPPRFGSRLDYRMQRRAERRRRWSGWG